MPIVVGSPTSTTDRTVLDLVAETRRHLGGNARGLLNKLSGAIADSTANATMVYDIGGITANSYVGIDDEVAYVWTANSGTKQITAWERGMLGSTAASHADGALVEVQPRFSQFAIKRALVEEIQSWPAAKLFQVAQIPITLAANQRAYDLVDIPADFYDILDVDISPDTADTSLTWKEERWRVQRGPSTTFPSGAGLIFQNPVSLVGQTLVVTYSAPFTVTFFSDGVTVETAIGIPASAFDIAPLGAAARLLSTQEVIRTNTNSQGESRNAQEVPPLHIQNAAKSLFNQRDMRLDQEANRLRAKYPIRFW